MFSSFKESSVEESLCAEENNASSTRKKISFWKASAVTAIFTTVTAAGLGLYEAETSWYQSRYFGDLADTQSYTLTNDIDAEAVMAPPGPYNVRYGYVDSHLLAEAAENNNFQLTAQVIGQNAQIFDLDLPLIYREKDQAGLTLQDTTGEPFHTSFFPRQIYSSFEEVPVLLAQSLLFVENGELLEEQPLTQNPAIEWRRLIHAMFGQAIGAVGLESDGSGASTIPTQMEKIRHTEDGLTRDYTDKFLQMATASLRAYTEDAADTTQARRDSFLSYVNSMPLSAYRGFGEVVGFADGMSLWFGNKYEDVNGILDRAHEELDAEEMDKLADVYRATLGLIMAVQRPSYFLGPEIGRQALEERIDAYLPLMEQAGIISERLREATEVARLDFNQDRLPEYETIEPPKIVTSSLIDLSEVLGEGSLYNLGRFDLVATSTTDHSVNEAVADSLYRFQDPAYAEENGLIGSRLLSPEQASRMNYSFTLYERTDEGNVLRVQTDNFDGQLNLNEGTKLELGSTAKLRTLITYLEVISDLYTEYQDTSIEDLEKVSVHPDDRLTGWVLEYLADPEQERSREAILEAAMDRTYSGNPHHSFYTGGGRHRFSNFNSRYNGEDVSVELAFHKSINLPFIRMMEDIVNNTVYHQMGIDSALFEDREHPDRYEYLSRFADAESQTFMWRFREELHGKSPEEIAAELADKTRRTPPHLAVVHRSLFPEESLEEMTAFIQKECESCSADTDFEKLYERYAPGSFDLNDRGYITGIHPLQIWLAEQITAGNEMSWNALVEESADVRTETYEWLFKSSRIDRQNNRIWTILEQDAFEYIHASWQEKGFPFDNMVPSLASSIGVSGDSPAALAELAGIIASGGLRQPATQFSDIRLAIDTPYEKHFDYNAPQAVRVLPEELTRIVLREMQGVVEEGTAQRAQNAVSLDDEMVLPLGGKTGTGDNRIETYNENGGLVSSTARNRTAAFVFVIDDRFYGTVVAYVPGNQADEYDFTSALPVQIFKQVVPDIQPVIDRAYEAPLFDNEKTYAHVPGASSGISVETLSP